MKNRLKSPKNKALRIVDFIVVIFTKFSFQIRAQRYETLLVILC